MINGDRIKQAREFRGWTQRELAGRLGVTQPWIAQIEAGIVQPGEATLASIAVATRFPPAFFVQGPPPDVPLGTLLFRARSATTAAERMRVHRHAQVLVELATDMLRKIKLRPMDIPRLMGTQEEPVDPAHAAGITRTALDLSPDVPIDHLVRTLEVHGVLVFALPAELDLRGVDAFAFWTDADVRRPVIVVSWTAPGDRLRWSVAHELGHLVIHQPPDGTITHLERQANQFAAEFLLPEAAMRQELVPPLTLASVAPLKLRWKVSMQALIRRARDLAIITERQYHYLFEQLGMRGWRTREPATLDIPAERPRAMRQLAEMLYRFPSDPRRIAEASRLAENDVVEMLGAFAGAEKTGTDGDLGKSPSVSKVVPFTRRR